jgi:hypothetical protein
MRRLISVLVGLTIIRNTRPRFSIDDNDLSFDDTLRRVVGEGRMPATVRSASLANYADVARQVGIDPLRRLRRFRIDSRALRDGEMRVPVKRIAALLEATADEAGCSDFGLRMADQRSVSDLGVISLVVSHQPTVRDVHDTMVRYCNLLNAALALHVEEAGDVAVVKEELVDVPLLRL